MKKRDIENKLRRGFTADAPKTLSGDVIDAFDAKPQGAVKARKPISIFRAATAIAAALIIVAVGGAAVFLNSNPAVDQLPAIVPQTQSNDIVANTPPSNTAVSTVMLDVNPGIDIKVDQNENVIAVTPLNDDGVAIIGDMTFEGKTLDETVTMLIESMIENGYISELANSVLVSVDCDDAEKAARLQEKLTAEILALLEKGELDGAILSQTVKADDALTDKATANNISYGKAVLIERIIALDPLKTFDELAALPINDLNHIITTLSAASTEPTDLKTSGTASDKAYIGKDAALQAALDYPGITADSVTAKEVELDYENGVMCYEIELVVNGIEYEFDIDATTGDVLEVKEEAAEDDDDDRHDNDDDRDDVDDRIEQAIENGDSAYITADAAKTAALAHAGLAEADITDYDCEADSKNGQAVYEIEFQNGDSEYSYIVDAVSGEILHSETEIDD